MEPHDENGPRLSSRRTVILVVFVFMLSAFLFSIGINVDGLGPAFAPVAEGIKVFAVAVFVAVVALVWHQHQVVVEAARGIERAVGRRLETIIPGRMQYGLAAFHDELDFAALFRQLEPGWELLWLDTYYPRWSSISSELSKALSRGARIKMLVIDPSSDNARYRSQEITDDKGQHTTLYEADDFRRDVESFTRQLVKQVDDVARSASGPIGSCEIRMYRDLPSIPMYIIRDSRDRQVRGYSSFFLTRPTGFFVHLEWHPTNAESALLPILERYFLEKWDRQVPPQGAQIYPVPSRIGLHSADGIDPMVRSTLVALAANESSRAKLIESGTTDPDVGVRVIKLALANGIGYFAAEIRPSQQVAAHVHDAGSEVYLLQTGSARLHIGPMQRRADVLTVAWRSPVQMEPNDLLVVPEGWAHSLENTGTEPAVILFACPPAHMQSTAAGGDRQVVSNQRSP